MPKELIVSSTSLETRIAILEDDRVTEVFIERTKSRGIHGDIYKGRVTKVLPGMQAAFVDVGLERNAFLYVTDFSEDSDEFKELISDVDSEKHPDSDEPAGSYNKNGGRRGKRRRRDEPRENGRAAGSQSAPEPRSNVANGPPVVLNERVGRVLRTPPASVLPTELELMHPKHARVLDRLTKSSQPRPAKILPDNLGPLVSVPEEDVRRSFEERNAALAREVPSSVLVGDDPQTELLSETPDSFIPPAASDERAETDAPEEDSRARQENGNARVESRERPRPLLRKRTPNRGNARSLIGDLLKEGQEVLVQVSKEPIGKKGARITSHVALPGRYMVYMPTVDHIGVSRRIVSDRERVRLRRVVQENRGSNGRGFIVRTAGENQEEANLILDIKYLTSLWDDIRTKAEKGRCPRLIHAEPGLTDRILRDYLSPEFRAIRVDDEDAYAHIVEFVNRFNPALINRVRMYNKRKPIFEEFAVSTEIENALKEKVWLKNGGHIVINQTEALVAIDVNTGKYVGNTDSLEDTITRANLDAVKEVVRQIRLRDLGGIIVVDFIDMDERRNRQKVMDAMRDELSKDKSPSKVLHFNEFGLLAITRKRVKQSLERTLCQPCHICEGSGLTKSVRTICYSIHTEIRRLRRTFGEGRELLLRCHPEVAKALRKTESQVIREIEEMTGKVITTKPDPLLHIESFDFIEQ